MSAFGLDTEAVSVGAPLSVVLIGPDEPRRRAVAELFSGDQSRIARELAIYPHIDELGPIFETRHDVVLVDLDPDPERALDVVETICGTDRHLTVIVYSSRTDPELLVRSMRAGAREFLTEPVQPKAAAEALVRASARRDAVPRVRKAVGKLFVFAGVKGGSGVTTLASNFALSLAKDSGAKVALLDLNLQLGDCAVLLGVTRNFSTADAFDNVQRLDSDFLAAMLAKHSSGLCVLGSPDSVLGRVPPKEAIEQLLRLARENFHYVVVDAGIGVPEVQQVLFEAATAVYLVVQVAVSELRNANRIITHYFAGAGDDKLAVVLNRFSERSVEIDDAAVAKALTRPATWKIPGDYPAVRRAQNTGIPIVEAPSPLGQAIRDMARAASGQAAPREKKKRFGLFG